MKNFNKPEVILSTLEIDEVKRLYESIKYVVSIKEAEIVHSMRQGYNECLVKVSLLAHA